MESRIRLFSEESEDQDGQGSGGKRPSHARRMAELRRALISHVQPEDIEDVTLALLDRAKSGDLQAVRLLFSYVLEGWPK